MCQRQQKIVKKRHALLILPSESNSQTIRITTNLVKNDVFLLPWGTFKEKKTVELKFITAAPPYSLNNLETRICRKFNFGCLRASLSCYV